VSGRDRRLFQQRFCPRQLALQLPFLEISESMGDHDSQIMDAGGVD
jgi:hypothetical protein